MVITTGAFFTAMGEAGAARLVMLADPPSGLQAIVALDDLTRGPAGGGIRTQRYGSLADAILDAQALAAAMSLKTAIADLPAGGGKTVVIDHPGLDRPAAFRRLGAFIEELGGLYRAAGDYGTTVEDLKHAATETSYVNTDSAGLAEATGRGVTECLRALAGTRGHRDLAGLRVAVQGCGAIGGAVARCLHAEGAALTVADVNAPLAAALAAELDAKLADPGTLLTAEVDILAPCALGGVITTDILPSLRAWGICGGANNQLADPRLAADLAARGVAFIPDFLSSAGGVIAGIAQSLMGGTDPVPLLVRLGDTAREVLRLANEEGRSTVEVAETIARRRIAETRERANLS